MAQTTTKAPTRPQQNMPPPQNAVAVIAPPRLMPPESTVLQSYDVDNQGWRTLVESIFPAAKTATSVMMALDYCKRRKLDVFKHPVHIVPIWNSAAGENGKGAMVETIWPGINELRTTAIRTGQYAGMDVPTFGPLIERTFKGKIKKWANGGAQWDDVEATVQFPEWCQITVYRTLGGNRVPFPGPRVFWVETYSRLRNDCEVPNSMWEKRANGQLEKCAEAAALRRAFPEELGSDYSIDEIGAFTTHTPMDVTDDGSATTTAPPEPKLGDYKPAASPPGGDGQPGEKAAAAPTATPGQPATGKEPFDEKASAEASLREQAAAAGQVTDVVDQNEQPARLEFQEYKRVGDFFAFSDPWLQDPKRTPDEARQWEAFYREYLKEKANSKSDPVRAAVADTLGMYSAVLAKEMQREPGQEG